MGDKDKKRGKTNQDQREEMEAALKNARVNGEIFEQLVKEIARQYYQFYTHLVGAGFTKEQALEIVKARGVSYYNGAEGL